MIMNDDSLKQLFADYRPEMPSRDDFMDALDRRLEKVEFLRSSMDAAARRRRRAAAAACVAGIVSGIIMGLILPHIDFSGMLSGIAPKLHVGAEELSTCLGWVITAALTLLLSFNTYEVSLLLGRRKEE